MVLIFSHFLICFIFLTAVVIQAWILQFFLTTRSPFIPTMGDQCNWTHLRPLGPLGSLKFVDHTLSTFRHKNRNCSEWCGRVGITRARVRAVTLTASRPTEKVRLLKCKLYYAINVFLHHYVLQTHIKFKRVWKKIKISLIFSAKNFCFFGYFLHVNLSTVF